jgi:hypothetical protein
MPRLSAITLRILSTALFVVCVTSVHSQSSQTLIPGTGLIPSEHFKSWSLFLFCDSKWVRNNQNDPDTGLPGYGTYELYKDFQAFGTAIGNDNLAVWFWRSNSILSEMIASNVDVTRAQHFCTAYHLKFDKGPYLIVTSTFPDEANLGNGVPPNSAVFTLGSMKLKQIAALLNQVSHQLNPVPPSLPSTPQTASDTSPARPVEPWQVRLLTSVQQVLNNFGCAWTFNIDAGVVKADLHACGRT